MQLTTTLIAAFAAIALAAPPTYPSEIYEAPTLANITATESDAVVDAVVKRGERAGATWCEHTMHTTPCSRFDFEQYKCHNLPRYWNDKISSIFPFTRNERCIVYENANCKGKRLTVTWPGINKLGEKGMNDKISSIECFKFIAS